MRRMNPDKYIISIGSRAGEDTRPRAICIAHQNRSKTTTHEFNL